MNATKYMLKQLVAEFLRDSTEDWRFRTSREAPVALNRRILLLGIALAWTASAQDPSIEDQDGDLLFTAVNLIGNDVPEGIAPWLDVLSLSLDLGNDPNSRSGPSGWTPLHVLAFRPVTWMGGNVAFSDQTEAEWIEGIRLLLEAGANPNIQDSAGQTPLHGASTFSGEEPVKMLLGSGADPNIPNIEGKTPLDTAIAHGNESAVASLLGAGAQL